MAVAAAVGQRLPKLGRSWVRQIVPLVAIGAYGLTACVISRFVRRGLHDFAPRVNALLQSLLDKSVACGTRARDLIGMQL
jgi:hypothetical protein